MAKSILSRPAGAHFPHSIDDKIVCAKSIVQAVIAAHDGAQDLGNYDIGWPLRVAVELLEQAADQVGRKQDEEAQP